MNITIQSGTTKRLLTGGKYCLSDIIVTAEGSASRLPDGYTELEYIESTPATYTAGQRIDTGFIPNSNTRVVCDFQFTKTTSSFQALLGSRSSSANRFCLWLTNGGVFRSDYNTSNLSFSSSLSVTERHTLDFNKNVCSIDGSVVTHSAGTFNGVCNLYLFASDTDGSADIHGNVKIYSCRVYDNGTLVRDFVPCRNPYGVVGLFDLVNAQFYGNAGTGEFVGNVPATRPDLPVGYAELAYIQSSGTQYIDTGVTHSSTNNIVLRADVSYDTVSPANQIMGFTGNAGNGIGLAKAAWWEASSIPSATVGTRYSLEWGVNGTGWHRTVNGKTVTGTRTTKDYSSNLFLFASLSAAGYTDIAYHCSCKMYWAKVFVDGTLIRDYVPCISPSGTAGLYDMVNAKFYDNAGTGAFLGG